MTKRIHRTVKADGSLFAASKDVQSYPKTGIVYQEFKLFIEGIEVPFISISIGQSYNGLPTANIQIPYFAGLQEIAKNYSPKVHVFYKDYVFEKYLISKGATDYEESDILRTLFEGLILTSSYGRAKGADSGSAYIQFSCVHKHDLLNQILLKFGGRGPEAANPSSPEATAYSNYMNSPSAILDALMGVEDTTENHVISTVDTSIVGVQAGVNVRAMDPDTKPYFNRLQGVPGITAVLWNSIKRDSYAYKNYAVSMTKMYIPLVDEGLRLFRRMSGHPYLERSLEAEKIGVNASELSKRASINGLKGDPKIIVPANYRNFINDAVAVEVALSLAETGVQFSGDNTSIIGMFTGILDNMMYGVQVLSSPIQSVGKDEDTINTLVKPLIPFYFSPTCNVLLPHMYTSITVNDATNTSPTRVTTTLPTPGTSSSQSAPDLEYRGPHEVRLAAALGAVKVGADFNLLSTTVRRGEYPAIHELGRGILLKPIGIKPWIQHLFHSYEIIANGGADTESYVLSQPTYEVIPGSTPTPLAPKSGGRSSSGAASVIDVARSPKEVRTPAIWKYWDNTNNKIPYYYGSVSTKGKNIVYGKQGVATVGGTENTKIETFRTTTTVPTFWNVVYFPFNDSLYAYPPHYDYIRRQWFLVDEIPKQYHKEYSLVTQYSGELPANATYLGASNAPFKEPVPKTTVLLTNPVASLDALINPPPSGNLASNTSPEKKTWEDDTLEKLRVSWNTDHPGQETLNPYSPTSKNGVQPYQITIINTLDYDYALSLVEARQGNVDGMFNPFIIPGYPMDIIDPSPERPSFHAFCVSVTHTITPRMATTSISFSSCLTYDELRNYELPALLPWYRKQLGFIDKLSLIHQTDGAKDAANKFYRDVLGCGYADPTILEDERTNSSNFVKVNNIGDFEVTKTGANIAKENSVQSMVLGFTDQNLSYEGNMALIRREIETMSDVEHFSGITFIPISPSSDKDGVEFAEREVKVSALRSDYIQKPGRSLFLDYGPEEGKQQREVDDQNTVTTEAT